MIPRFSATLLLLLATLPSPAMAAVPDVFVEPLALYNAPDLGSLAEGLRAMMASRLEGEGYTVRTSGDAPHSPGSWIVRASITRLGKIYSLDASLEPAAGSAEGARSYQTADGMDKLVPALEQVAEHLRSDLAFRMLQQPTPSVGQPPTTPPQPLTPTTPPPPVPAATTPPPAPLVPAKDGDAKLQAALQNQRLGPELTGEAKSMAVGDVDGDGNQEILILLDDTIVAFRDVGRELHLAWDSAVPRNFTPTTLSLGDFDGNRLPELFVAGISGTSPTTQAMEWFGSALAPKGGRLAGFLRAVPHPDQGDLLLGMARGSGGALFANGIRRYRWNGTSYEEQGQFPAPEQAIGVNLDFLRIGEHNQVTAVLTTQGNVVQGIDAEGRVLFALDDKVKGTRVRLAGEEEMPGYLDQDTVRISGRTLVYRTPDGRDYLLLYRNGGGLMGRMFDRITTFSNGQVRAYGWDGLSLSPGPETGKYTGFVADVDLGTVPGASSPTLYVALVNTSTGLFNDPTTRVVAYDLP